MFLPGRGQLADAIDLLVGQRVGQHQPDQGKQIAARFGIAQVGHALAAQTETPPGVGAGGIFNISGRSRVGMWVSPPAMAVKISTGTSMCKSSPVALEGVIGQDVHDQIQISSRPTVVARLPLTCQANS